jgi:hypothetical protein
MENQKLEEKNMTTQSLINVPTYLGSNPILRFFYRTQFVGSTNVPHDAHVLGAKYHH